MQSKHETSEQSVHRKQQDRKCKASTRANKTSEQRVHIKQQDRKHKASIVDKAAVIASVKVTLPRVCTLVLFISFCFDATLNFKVFHVS